MTDKAGRAPLWAGLGIPRVCMTAADLSSSIHGPPSLQSCLALPTLLLQGERPDPACPLWPVRPGAWPWAVGGPPQKGVYWGLSRPLQATEQKQLMLGGQTPCVAFLPADCCLLIAEWLPGARPHM